MNLKISRRAATDSVLCLWLVGTLIVAIVPRGELVNLLYGATSLLILLVIIRYEPKRTQGASSDALICYLAATILPLIMNGSEGGLGIFYFWVLGINSLLAIFCFRALPPASLMICARLLMVTAILIAGYVSFGDYTSNDEIDFLGGSSNLLTFALMAVVCWYCYVCVLSGGKSPIIIPVAMLAFSIFMGGRSGIIISFGIILLSVGFRVSRSLVQLLLFIVAAGLVGITFSGGLMEQVSDVLSGTRIIHGFADEVRLEMRKEYITSIDWVGLLLGSEYNPSGLISSYGDNPHNSFIRAHHMFGLAPVVLFMILVAVSIRKLVWNPTRPTLFGFSLGCLLLVRAFYDSVVFWFELDFIIFLLLLSPLLSAKSEKKGGPN